MKRKPVIALILFAIVLLVPFFRHLSAKPQEVWQYDEGVIFGTVYHVKYLYTEDLKADIEAELQRVDASLSMFNPKSTISRINSGESDLTDEMLTEVLTLAKRVSAATDGAFDPTVAPLVNAWGFGFKNGQLPDAGQVDSLRALVGLDAVSLEDGHLVCEKDGIVLDFSAIAKGYGVDRAAAVLQAKGITRYMVEIGGEVVAHGTNDKAQPWRIGINKPDDDSLSTNTELQDIIALSDNAIATSGNYRNFYTSPDGRRIAHTIDPRTGYPAQKDILSSTVMASTCAEADAYATAFMVLGLEQAQEFLSTHPELQAYFICSDDKGRYVTWSTEGFKAYIQE